MNVKSAFMTTTYKEEAMLLNLQQAREKYSLLVKHHTEIAIYDKENKGPVTTAAMLLRHSNELFDLSNKYLKLRILLQDKFKVLAKVVVEQNLFHE